MWFGLLTPGAHPSRAVPSDEATVFRWTQADRGRIDGPFDAVQGGLRVTRRLLHEAGIPHAPPRCFVCRTALVVPDAEALREDPRVLRLPPDRWPPPLPAASADPACFALVHLRDLVGAEDPRLDEEEALVVLPRPLHFRLVVPFLALPEALGVVRSVAATEAPPRCPTCATVLPGSAEQRTRAEGGAAVRPLRRAQRRSHRRRAA